MRRSFSRASWVKNYSRATLGKQEGAFVLSQKSSAVMRVMFKLCSWVGKGYAFPSQRKIVTLCEKWCGVDMSKRTLNRVLSQLEEDCFINRTRRHCRGTDGQMVFHSTLYKLGGKAYNWAHELGTWSGRLFQVFRVPKLAQYKASATASYLSPVDNRVESGWAREEGAARSGPINLTFRTI